MYVYAGHWGSIFSLKTSVSVCILEYWRGVAMSLCNLEWWWLDVCVLLLVVCLTGSDESILWSSWTSSFLCFSLPCSWITSCVQWGQQLVLDRPLSTNKRAAFRPQTGSKVPIISVIHYQFAVVELNYILNQNNTGRVLFSMSQLVRTIQCNLIGWHCSFQML